VADT